MSLTKTVDIAREALPIIAAMEWREVNSKIVGVLTSGQLERNLYLAVNKGLETLGGKWDRKEGGHVFSTDPRPQLEVLLQTGTIEVARDGYYVTPHALGVEMALWADLGPGTRVFEPSAGTGNLARAIVEVAPGCDLWVAEKNIQRQQVLQDRGYRLLQKGDYDFLTADVGSWQRIIQNPPFEEGQDIAHVTRAHDCLMPGGVLVSVVSESPFFCDYSRHRAFRDWLRQQVHGVRNLAPDTFRESGAGVKARLVKVQK